MIIKAWERRSIRSTKHVNIQAHEHLNLKVHMHLTIQLHLDLTNLIKACMCPGIQPHKLFDLQAYTYIVDQVCSHVVQK